ncbi:MAG: hypothetical protein ABIH00_06730 [Armatimonadota bacterium]
MPIVTAKEKIRVVIITTHLRLEGEMHVIPGGRLLDEINKERVFLPVTDATIYDMHGENIIDTLEFIAVNKNQILLIAPANQSK